MDPLQLEFSDELARASGIALLGAFAIQRVVDLFDPLLVRLSAAFTGSSWFETNSAAKKWLSLVFSLGLGIAASWRVPLRSVALLVPDVSELADVVVTGLVIAAGTEGSNSLIKYFSYVKDAKKPADKPKE